MMNQSNWGMSTNLINVFNLILEKAKEEKISQEQMPDVITIISDMQFDSACEDNSKTNLEVIREKYEKYGYFMPQIVFWNVAASSDVPATMNDQGICLISGSSPSILLSVFGIQSSAPYDFMLQVLNSDRYSSIH